MANVDNIFALNQALDGLEAVDPKTRREAAQQIAALKDPSAIPTLAEAWRSEQDTTVRKAMESALIMFRRMEQKQSGKRRGGSGILNVLLTVVLLAAVGGNLYFLSQKGLPVLASGGDPSAPTDVVDEVNTNTAQELPELSRDQLIALFTTRVTALRTGVAEIRSGWTSVQPRIITKVRLDCPTLTEIDSKEYTLAAQNAAYYPGVSELNSAINTAAREYVTLRATYNEACVITDQTELRSYLDANGGNDGDSFITTRADRVQNGAVNTASDLLDRAVRSPQATLIATNTPTEAPTETPAPTSTPNPEATATPVPPTPDPNLPTQVVESGGGTSIPTEVTPTVGPTSTATPVPVLTYENGFAALARYKYRVTYRYDGIDSRGNAIRGVVVISATVARNPLVARYDISITESEANPLFQSQSIFAPPAEGLYRIGTSSYAIIDGVYYLTGTVADNRCRSTQATEPIIAQFAALEDRLLGTLFVRAVTGSTNSDLLGFYDRLPVIQSGSGRTRYSDTFTGKDPTTGADFVRVVDVRFRDDLNVLEEGAFRETATFPASYIQTSLTLIEGQFNLEGVNEQVAIESVTAPATCG